MISLLCRCIDESDCGGCGLPGNDDSLRLLGSDDDFLSRGGGDDDGSYSLPGSDDTDTLSDSLSGSCGGDGGDSLSNGDLSDGGGDSSDGGDDSLSGSDDEDLVMTAIKSKFSVNQFWHCFIISIVLLLFYCLQNRRLQNRR